MRRTTKILGMMLVLLTSNHVPALAEQSLSTSFVDVAVLDVPLGTPKKIQDSQGQGLILRNTSDQLLRVHVEIVIPKPEQLRGNAESIPDPQWISVEPADLLLPPHASTACEMHVLVPDQNQYQGRFYQAMVWTRARPISAKGISVSVGLLSRLRLKIESR